MEAICLPIGYYAVSPEWTCIDENVTFDMCGKRYSAVIGINAFSSFGAAEQKADIVPQTVLSGLSYEKFITPVILFCSGEHNIDKTVITRSVTVLGSGASQNPNVPCDDPLMPWDMNNARGMSESIFIGTTYHGTISIISPEAKTVIFDGVELKSARLWDRRKTGGDMQISLKNVIFSGGSNSVILNFFELAPSPDTQRKILLENIRVDGYDGYDGDGIFIFANADELNITGLYYANTNKFFGFTNFLRQWPNVPAGQKKVVYKITDSCFYNATGLDGIKTECRDVIPHDFTFKISNTSFINASAEGCSVLNPHLPNRESKLEITDCTFMTTSQKSKFVALIRGSSEGIRLENNMVLGYPRMLETYRKPEITVAAEPEDRYDDWVTGGNGITDPHTVTGSKDRSFAMLDKLYEGMHPYYGDLHIHTNSGGKSDGAVEIGKWPEMMRELSVDFAAVVDHRQIRHMFIPEWDDKIFICGTEPGTHIIEGLSAARDDTMHYNMLFEHKNDLEKVLEAFPEFEFTGGIDGVFKYPRFKKQRLVEIASFVRSIGGCFVHAHPKQLMASVDPLDYYFGEKTIIETIYGDLQSYSTLMNYRLWCDLLALGKKVYASAGSDSHTIAFNTAVSTVYSSKKEGSSFECKVYEGDFTAGPAGVKMCIGDAKMGSEVSFKQDLRLQIRVGDFFPPAVSESALSLNVYTDKGLAYTSPIYAGREFGIEMKVEKRAFYRVEIFNNSDNHIMALGNPIWII